MQKAARLGPQGRHSIATPVRAWIEKLSLNH